MQCWENCWKLPNKRRNTIRSNVREKNCGPFPPIFFSKCSSRHVECSFHYRSGESFFKNTTRFPQSNELIEYWRNFFRKMSSFKKFSWTSRNHFWNRFEKIFAKTKTFFAQNPNMKNTSKIQLVSKRFSGQLDFRFYTIFLKSLWECWKKC